MIKVDELVKVALDLGAFKSDKNQLPLLSEDRQKLLQASSIDGAFIILGEHMSFFNYEILSHTVYPLTPGSTYICLEMGVLYCTYGG